MLSKATQKVNLGMLVAKAEGQSEQPPDLLFQVGICVSAKEYDQCLLPFLLYYTLYTSWVTHGHTVHFICIDTVYNGLFSFTVL
jgi:hypothetical protein